MTKNAERILNIVNESVCHPTAEQIFFELKKENPKAVLATVYNNLTTLSEQGKIRKLKLKDGPDRYDKIIPHDHMVCERCGKIVDVQCGNLTELIESAVGCKITSYDLAIHYVCDECRHEDERS